MSVRKHKIVLDLEHENLVELRKILFNKGLSVQYFLTFVLELIAIRDPRIDSIIVDAIENKSKNPLLSSKANADTLYQMIEQELRKKNTNGAGQ
jgi:hypothetical protein